MMISKLQKEADFAELSKDINTEYLNDMGELFANFEAYDVQETRRIAREEAREEGIRKIVQAVKAIVNSQTSARQQLMEQYELSEEEAEKKVELYW